MVVLNKIYTKTGDAGTTALGTGERVAKTSPRIEAYGTVDELNACLGLAALAAQADYKVADVAQMLFRVQNDLFDLGADLCTPETEEPLEYEPLRVSDKQVERLESEIDDMNAALEPLRSFVLPGGSELAARLHLARTVCRRAERRMALLAASEGEVISPTAARYINRLSDHLFVASRYANAKAEGDVLWVPGANR